MKVFNTKGIRIITFIICKEINNKAVSLLMNLKSLVD